MADILVIDHRLAAPDEDAGSLRMVNLMRVLNGLGHTVTYLPEGVTTGRSEMRYRQLAKTVPCRTAAEGSVARHLRRHSDHYDVVLLCRPGPAQRHLGRVRRRCRRAKAVFDTVDLHYLRELRQSEIESDLRRRRAALDSRRRELDLVRATDATLVVSTYEAELLGRELPQALVRVVPTIHELPPPGPDFERRRGLLFVAGFEHAPNVDAAQWLVAEIMPLVWQQEPDLTLALVGSHPPASIMALRAERIEVTGPVSDLEGRMHEARLSLAPLRFGAGVKGKITHSLALGLPVVATTIACEGMPIEADRDILVADRKEDFATAVIRAYRQENLWRDLASSGRRLAAKHFSFAAASATLQSLLLTLGIDSDRPAIG